jgi:hypothetical protein
MSVALASHSREGRAESIEGQKSKALEVLMRPKFLAAPEGRPSIARGASPWKLLAMIIRCSPGGATLSTSSRLLTVAPPGLQKSRITYLTLNS